MRSLILVFALAVLGCAQTHNYELHWDYNTEPDMDHYRVYIGSAGALNEVSIDSLVFVRTVSHDSLQSINPSNAIVIFESMVDGEFLFAGVQAVDDSSNTSSITLSAPYKKNDEFSPGDVINLFIRR